ncbi:MAG: OmpA family protein [Gallionella sp.]|nr:OmpA family protein [Gallionella sp.]
MQKKIYFPLTLIAVAILAGCAATKNVSLTEAHSSYNSAATNPQVTTLAALELKEAGDSLNKADYALSEGESTATVDHLAYIAKQKVGVAQETAKRKAAELAVTNASAKRDQARLEARTAEADAAKQQVATMQETADQQAAALAAADANADQQATALAAAGANADQQAAALAAADANAERDQALIAQQEMQLKELNAKKTERGLVITLGDVLFSVNKAQLKSGGMRNMQKLAGFLNKYPQHKILVEGFTDSTGSDSYNQELSERRANAVRTALIDMGVGGDRVTTRGYGEAFPVASNDTASSRQLNRRVEIILSDNNGNIAPR